jgi:hypothetical protein
MSMAERANAKSGTVQTPTAGTQEKPPPPTTTGGNTGGSSTSSPPPSKPTQAKLTQSDFHATPDKPYIAATDSGYKVFPQSRFGVNVPSYGSTAGYRTVMGPEIQGPDGKKVGVWDEKGQKWVQDGGKGAAVEELKGIKPDPAWSQTSVQQPGMPSSEVFDKPPKSNAS